MSILIRSAPFAISLCLHGATAGLLFGISHSSMRSGGQASIELKIDRISRPTQQAPSSPAPVSADAPAPQAAAASEPPTPIRSEEPPKEALASSVYEAASGQPLSALTTREADEPQLNQAPSRPSPVPQRVGKQAPESTPSAAPAKIAPKAKKTSMASVAVSAASSQTQQHAHLGAAGVDPGLRAAYLSMIAARLESRKFYPSEAVAGTVVVRFTVARSGDVSVRQVVRGSGSEVLDSAALAMVERSTPFPAFPAELSQARLDITVPISFRNPK